MSKPKPTIYLYEVRTPTGAFLSRVVLTSDGFFSTVGAFGSYAYWWGSIGVPDSRAFLTDCDDDYLLSKISSHTQWDGKRAFEAVKRYILSERRTGALSREQAREAWRGLKEADEFAERTDVERWLEKTKLPEPRNIIFDYSFLTYPSQAKMFCERVMPRLREMLVAEMAAEAEATRAARSARCFFFGCWNVSGHYLHDANGRHFYDREVERFGDGMSYDGTLAPRRLGGIICWEGQAPDGRQRQRIHYEAAECPQGEFLLHHLDNGFTAISWWDRQQGDQRGACNSTLLLEGAHTSEEMLTALRLRFPHVLANLQKAGVELVDVTPASAAPRGEGD